MNRTYFYAIFIFLITSQLISQQLSEKSIVKHTGSGEIYPYEFVYDNISGSYIYTTYDSVAKKSTLFTNKGKGNSYSGILSYNTLFDSKGNFFLTAYNNITDTTYKYFFLVNGKEACEFDYIFDGYKEKDGIVYIHGQKNMKHYLAKLDVLSGMLDLGKEYDEIYFVKIVSEYFEGEPATEIGFTNEGLAYFVASKNNEKFVVIGDKEMKHYSDISLYDFKLDAKGQPIYIAKSDGPLYETKGNTFIVHGDKEYKKFDYVYGPILTDASNTPVYIAADSLGDWQTRQRVMVGDKEMKATDGYISYITFTKSGKLAYVSTKETSGDRTQACVMIDGVEGKKFQSIGDLKFDGDIPIYYANVDDNTIATVFGSKITKYNYQSIMGMKKLGNGDLCFIGMNYGNYEKKIPDKNYVHIGSKKLGPYDYIQVADYLNGDYVLTDKSGNYAFIGQTLVNRENYLYSQTLYGNDFESKQYDYIDNINLYKGHIIYVASNTLNTPSQSVKYKVYIDDKTYSGEYNSINNFKLNEMTGKVTFIGFKNIEFFYVTIIL